MDETSHLRAWRRRQEALTHKQPRPSSLRRQRAACWTFSGLTVQTQRGLRHAPRRPRITRASASRVTRRSTGLDSCSLLSELVVSYLPAVDVHEPVDGIGEVLDVAEGAAADLL